MLHVAYRSKLPAMTADARDQDREWIGSILRERGWTATELARRAGLSQTTLTRFMSPDWPHSLSGRTRAAIASTVGLAPQRPIPASPTRPRPAGFSEPDAVEFEAVEHEADKLLRAAVKAALAAHPHAAPFMLRTRSLQQIGYRPGDVLLVDINGRPAAGDLVCAQLFDWPNNRADTVFRVFQPPFLLTGLDPEGHLSRPMMVDDHAVAIRGVVILSVRTRLHAPREAA